MEFANTLSSNILRMLHDQGSNARTDAGSTHFAQGFTGENQGGNQRRNPLSPSGGNQPPPEGNPLLPVGNPGGNPEGGNPGRLQPNIGLPPHLAQQSQIQYNKPKYDPPAKFEGTASKYIKWKEDCGLYILSQPSKYLNAHVGILFMLIHMEEAAAPWRTQYLQDHNVSSPLQFPTMPEFLRTLDAVFLPYSYP